MIQIPVILLSGFLGSGKTTLLLRLLQEARDKKLRTAVLMNELGSTDVDGRILGDDLGSGSMEKLLDGCICCSKKSEVADCLLKLLDRNPEVIFVELTGVANPEEVADALTEPQLVHRLYLRRTVTLLDAEHVLEYNSIFQSDRELVHTLRRQIETADLLIVNKSDLVDDARLAKVGKAIRKRNPDSPILYTSHSRIDLAPLFQGLDEQRLSANNGAGAENQGHGACCVQEGESGDDHAHHHVSQPGHTHLREHHHDHDRQAHKHSHQHNHTHDHDHTHQHEHQHNHAHTHQHERQHNHAHTHQHERQHNHAHTHQHHHEHQHDHAHHHDHTYEHQHERHDRRHDHTHEHDHHHAHGGHSPSFSRVRTLTLPVNRPVRRGALEKFLRRFRPSLLRAKGYFPVVGENGVQLMQLAGNRVRWEPSPYQVEMHYMVLIGLDLEAPEAERLWREAEPGLYAD